MNISSAAIGHRLHVAIVHEGRIQHRVREMSGAWTPWGTIEAPQGHEFDAISCSCVDDCLHIVVKNVNGVYFHAIRFPDGSWQGLAQIPGQPLLQ